MRVAKLRVGILPVEVRASTWLVSCQLFLEQLAVYPARTQSHVARIFVSETTRHHLLLSCFLYSPMRFMALHACTSQINFKSCPVQCGSSVLRLNNSQYGGDMPELCPVVTPQEIIARIKESGTVPTPSTSSTASLTQAADDIEPEVRSCCAADVVWTGKGRCGMRPVNARSEAGRFHRRRHARTASG